jgi:hypothetical protein
MEGLAQVTDTGERGLGKSRVWMQPVGASILAVVARRQHAER